MSPAPRGELDVRLEPFCPLYAFPARKERTIWTSEFRNVLGRFCRQYAAIAWLDIPAAKVHYDPDIVLVSAGG
jgi:hypothetical protein